MPLIIIIIIIMIIIIIGFLMVLRSMNKRNEEIHLWWMGSVLKAEESDG